MSNDNDMIEWASGEDGYESEFYFGDALRFSGVGWTYNSYYYRFESSEVAPGNIYGVINDGYDADTGNAIPLVTKIIQASAGISLGKVWYSNNITYSINVYRIDETYDNTLNINTVDALAKTLLMSTEFDIDLAENVDTNSYSRDGQSTIGSTEIFIPEIYEIEGSYGILIEIADVVTVSDKYACSKSAVIANNWDKIK